MELQDETTLAENKIPNNGTLQMKPMEIKVQLPDGKVMDLQVMPSDSIQDIKEIIEDMEGIPKRDQRLTFQGKELDDDDATLEECNVPHGALVVMLPMQIDVITRDGPITIEAMPNDTVNSIKSKVFDETGVPIDDQRLVYKGKELDDPDATLANCDIHHGSKLSLEPMEIKVKTTTGELIPNTNHAKRDRGWY